MKLDFIIQHQQGDFYLNVKGCFSKEIIGVFGPSGSGKTTLLNCLAGFIKPDMAEIIFNKEIYDSTHQHVNLPIEKRNIGYVCQEPLLFPHLSVAQNIFYGVNRIEDKKYVLTVKDVLALYPLMNRYPSHLSGGEKQRVALARSLMRKPGILLMDEPLSSLDFNSKYQIISYLKNIHQLLKIPIIYVTHSISELLSFVDWVYVLEEGKNIQYGPTEDVLLSPHSMLSFERESVDNVFDLTVRQIKQDQRMIVLDWSGFSLIASYQSKQIRPRVKITFSAKDVMISLNVLSGVSARNMIPGIIKKIIVKENCCVCLVDVRGSSCFAEITKIAYEDLRLKVDMSVYLIIKARSIRMAD